MPDKSCLPERIATARTLLRRAMPEDLPEIAAWPDYPFPDEALSMAGPLAVGSPDGSYWWQQIEEPDRCHYSVVLTSSREVVGVHALVHIDWEGRVVRNMGIRIRPDVCGQGYGSETLGPLLQGVLAAGMRSIRLDVMAPNQRAVRCYQKCGMRIVEEFWQEYRGRRVQPSDPKWSFAIPHVRREGEKWMVRSYWMEINAP